MLYKKFHTKHSVKIFNTNCFLTTTVRRKNLNFTFISRWPILSMALIEIEPRLHYHLLTLSADQFPSAELLILEIRIQTSE